MKCYSAVSLFQLCTWWKSYISRSFYIIYYIEPCFLPLTAVVTTKSYFIEARIEYLCRYRQSAFLSQFLYWNRVYDLMALTLAESATICSWLTRDAVASKVRPISMILFKPTSLFCFLWNPHSVMLDSMRSISLSSNSTTLPNRKHTSVPGAVPSL